MSRFFYYAICSRDIREIVSKAVIHSRRRMRWLRNQLGRPAEIRNRTDKDDRVQDIQHAAEPWNPTAGVLATEIALDERLGQVASHAADSHHHCKGDPADQPAGLLAAPKRVV